MRKPSRAPPSGEKPINVFSSRGFANAHYRPHKTAPPFRLFIDKILDVQNGEICLPSRFGWLSLGLCIPSEKAGADLLSLTWRSWGSDRLDTRGAILVIASFQAEKASLRNKSVFG